MRLRAVAVRAVHAHGAVAQFLSQNGAELERRSQFHVHGARQVFLAEQWQRGTVDGLFPETLEKNKIKPNSNVSVHNRFIVIPITLRKQRQSEDN